MNYLKTILVIGLLFLVFMGCSSNKEADKDNLVSPEEMYETGNQQFAAGEYTEAIKSYESLLTNYPTSDLHIDTQLKIASVHGKLENFEQQMSILSRLLKENIIPDKVPQIFLQIGKFYYRAAGFNPGTATTDTSDYLKAISYYKKALDYQDSKDNNAKAEATYRRALTEAKIGQTDQAKTDYGIVIDYFPSTTYSLLATIKLTDVTNTSELATDEISLEKYRQQLGMEPMPEGEQLPANELPKEKLTEPGTESMSADSLFNMIKQDSSGNDL